MKIKNELIRSKQNPRIKNLLHLQKHNERLKQNLFIVEGIKEIEKALDADYEIDSLFFCPEIVSELEIGSLTKHKHSINIFETTLEIFNKVAYRQNSGGILVVAKPKVHHLEKLVLNKNPLILVIEGVEKPGNIGAIYRTADAAGISAIIICNPGTDLYNPNTVRSSLGCIFTIPTAISSSLEAIKWLKQRSIIIYTSYLKASIPYHLADFTKPTAIVVGTEATGVTGIWIDASDSNIIIPMVGKADSMNVSTATAVLIFEACRQRNFK